MGDKEAAEKHRRAMQSLKDKAKNEALRKLKLDQLFKDVVSKHKNLTQNRPQAPAPVNNQPTKKRKMRQKKQQQAPVHSQSVMQQIIQVISKLPPGLLINKIPSTSAMTPEQSVSQQPQLVAAITTGKSVLQQPGPFATVTPGQSVLQNPRPVATVAPGQSVLQNPRPVATMTPGQSVLQNPRPVATVAPGQSVLQNPRPVATMTPGQSVLQKSEAVALAIKKKRKRSKRGGQKNKKPPSFHQVNVVNVYNAGPSQFQAPHHDEPEDLTDDLAPNMSVQSVPQQPGSQPRAATSENKLNFKFQKTAQKNPDWSEYQNKFRRIGGVSPDSETADADREVKQEPIKDPSINTGFICDEDVEMKEVVNIDTSNLNVAIVTDPYNYLTEEQVKEINEALVNRIQAAIFNPNQLSYIPAFEDIPVHHLGHLPLKCQGPKDLIWLHDTLSSIPTPLPYTKLNIIPQNSLPDMVKIKFFVPNFSGNLADLQFFLQKQNSWYNMSSWTLIKCEKQGEDPASYNLEYCIPEMQALIIDNRDRRIAYSLGNLFISHVDFEVSEKIFSYRNVSSHLQVCVISTPFQYLTMLEVELIKQALVYKIEKAVFESEEEEYIPAFRGCPSHFKGGLKLWVESDRDLKWLRDAVGTLVSPAFGTILVRSPQSVSDIQLYSGDELYGHGSASVNPHTESPATAGQSQAVAQRNAAQKIVIQKVEILKPGKASDIPLKPIEVRCANTPNFQPNTNNMYAFPATPESFDYPKGIPKTFFVQDKRNQEPQAPPNLPHPGIPKQMLMLEQYHLPNAVYGFPAGIPKSFVIKERLQEAALLYNAPEVNPEPDYTTQSAPYVDLPSWILPSPAQKPLPVEIYEGVAASRGNAAYAQPEPIPDRAYSPSDAYSEIAGRVEEEFRDGSESPDLLQSGQKRLSAFKRLGPLTQPKKPKLTINLMLNKEQAVREVVDETDDSFRFIPVHLRKDIITSTDETVVKYLPFWPWKKNMVLRKTVSARFSKSVMILEQEQMETGYEKDSLFIQVSVKGYPKTWTKEDVLDAVLECVKGKSFIPSFIDFTPKECKFLVIRCRAALVTIHKVGFCIRKDDVELMVSISLTDTSLNQIDLIPRLVLRKRLMSQYDGEKALDLQEFLIEKDVSHFVYFPLSRVTNQMELVQLQSAVSWEHLTELNLSHNRLTSIDGFNLTATTPRLKHLDLSHNYLDKLTMLLRLRDLPLQSLKLEGNPLCHDYTDSAHYIKVVRMIFSGIKELDGVRIVLKGDLPPLKRNYCPEAAVPVVEKFLEVFFPLLETPYDDRSAIEDLYDKDAVLTVTYRYKLRYGSAYRYFRNLFVRSRSLEEGDMESVKGAPSISSLICKWPAIEHDRYTITVDVLHHDDSTTIFRVGGVLKVTADTLAEDEHLLTFTRNIVLHTRNGAEYKIQNEMLYWDVPCEEAIRDAFNITTVRPKQLSIKLESPPDKDLKSKLVDIFVKLADIDKKRGARCLELKNWDLRSALEYYISLLKLDDLAALSPPKKQTTPVPQAS